MEGEIENYKQFKDKVWITTGIVALVVIILWILKLVTGILLLIMAAVLIAIFFHGLKGLLQRYLHIKKGSLAIAIIISFIFLFLFFWLVGNSVQQQADAMSETLPAAIDNVKNKLNQSSIGQKIIKQLTADDNKKKAGTFIQTFFTTSFGVIGDLYVVILLGIFFTVGYKSYIKGMIKLAPASARGRTDSLLTEIGETLRKWLKGQLFAMLIVTVLTLIGLLIIGIPLALTLSLIAGILNFIPNFGPLIAIIPAALIAFLQGPTTALIVIGLYIVVQVLESSIITPQIQKKLIDMPPALIIIAQLMMGILTGSLGLVLATPIVAVIIVIVNELYVRKQDARSVSS